MVGSTGPFAQPTTEIHYATYDPSRGAWMPGVHRYAGTAVSYWTVSKLALANGTVAWQAAHVHHAERLSEVVPCGRGQSRRCARLATWQQLGDVLAADESRRCGCVHEAAEVGGVLRRFVV